MKCVCHEGTSILDGFSAIWFSFWIALNWIWNSLRLAFGLAIGSIVDYVLKNARQEDEPEEEHRQPCNQLSPHDEEQCAVLLKLRTLTF